MIPSERHRSGLWKLVDRLLGAKFSSGNDIWQLQLELLELQRRIQADIADEKKRVRVDRDSDRLSELQSLRWHARQFGDSIAWVLLGGDKQILTALSENSPVPISEEGHGAIGMQAMAEGLNDQGWGFPLLHDITDMLRIADITFVRPGREPRVVSAEVKTQLLDESEPDENGVRTRNYQSRVMTHVPLDPDGNAPSDFSVPTTRVDAEASRPRGRPGRQAVRMREALIKGSATAGLVEGLAQPLIHMEVTTPAADHWKAVRRLVRAAHHEGFTGGFVPGTFYYTAVLYSKDGLDEQSVKDVPLVEDLLATDFLKSERPEERSIVLFSIPPKPQRRPIVALPYFLYPISKRALRELLRGELGIFLMVNQGLVCDALRSRGMEVELRPEVGGPGEIVLHERWESPEGSFHGEIHAARHYIQEATREFRGVDYVCDLIEGISAGMRRHAPMTIPDDQVSGLEEENV